jgi:FkbM family methyltransferase
MIQRNLCLNRRFPSVAQGHVGIIAAPISADPSPLEMDLPPRCHGSFSVKTGLPQSDVPGQRMKYTINPVSMDDIFLGTGTRIDIMKIDTEGFEFNVLRSMRQLLMQKRVHYIIVEVAPERWLGEKIISREEATEEMLKIYDMQCSFKRVKLVNGDVHGSLEMSRDELKELLLHKMATMEDLLIQC